MTLTLTQPDLSSFVMIYHVLATQLNQTFKSQPNLDESPQNFQHRLTVGSIPIFDPHSWHIYRQEIAKCLISRVLSTSRAVLAVGASPPTWRNKVNCPEVGYCVQALGFMIVDLVLIGWVGHDRSWQMRVGEVGSGFGSLHICLPTVGLYWKFRGDPSRFGWDMKIWFNWVARSW